MGRRPISTPTSSFSFLEDRGDHRGSPREDLGRKQGLRQSSCERKPGSDLTRLPDLAEDGTEEWPGLPEPGEDWPSATWTSATHSMGKPGSGTLWPRMAASMATTVRTFPRSPQTTSSPWGSQVNLLFHLRVDMNFIGQAQAGEVVPWASTRRHRCLPPLGTSAHISSSCRAAAAPVLTNRQVKKRQMIDMRE